MNHNPTNFIECCLAGQALAEDIYSFIDQWHESNATVGVAQYLGMTADEYALWLEKPESIRSIIFAHQNRVRHREIAKWSCASKRLAFCRVRTADRLSCGS